jgi:hypothetical protein
MHPIFFMLIAARRRRGSVLCVVEERKIFDFFPETETSRGFRFPISKDAGFAQWLPHHD